MDHGRHPTEEAVREVWELVKEDAPPSVDRESAAAVCVAWSPGLASLALCLSDACNLRCSYCYLGSPASRPTTSMSEETATRAVDLLFDESFGERRLSIVFFGGEPLLNPGVIERVASHARARASREGRDVTFHMTTNGTLLTPEVAERLHGLRVRVLVSVDGGRAEHDAHRTFLDGRGSYDTIVANLAGLPSGMRVGARATVTEDSPPLPELVGHLAGLGFSVVHLAPVSGRPMAQRFAERLEREFEQVALGELAAMKDGRDPVVGNFVEPIRLLETGRRRWLPCGAGARYLAVGADGRLFFCHRMNGESAFEVGDVVGGFGREKAEQILGGFRTRAAGCDPCWARHLCGGPCHYDLERSPEDSVGIGAPRCRVRRKIFELSMWLYASLPEDLRSVLARAARRDTRPEIETRCERRAS